jgi:hypothetical protein
MAVAMPSHAELTRADRLGTALIVPEQGASVGTSAVPGTGASVGTSAIASPPTVIIDRSPPDRQAVVYQGDGPRALNVDWGDTVQFLVRQPGGPERIVKWRFNGLDNQMSFADIDPASEFARPVMIYVNQTANPLRNNSDGD